MIQFIKSYWKWIVALAGLNWAVWIMFELGHSGELGIRELWPLRMYLLSGLLLFDNLCVLWWYADRTHILASTSERQLGFQVSQSRVANKPIVFLDADRMLGPMGTGREDVRYVARNIGLGLAVNVYFVSSENGVLRTSLLGSIGPGQQLNLAARDENQLLEHRRRHQIHGRILMTEAMGTRTQPWIVTLNVLDGDGDVHHRFMIFAIEEPFSLEELLRKHGSQFEQELAAFLIEVTGR